MNADSARPTGSITDSASGEPAGQRLIVTVGNADFELGRTRIELDETGVVVVVSQQADKERSTAGQVSVDEAKAILRSVPLAVEKDGPDRPGIPDEARYEFEVIDTGRTIVDAALWEGQIEGSPSGRKLIEALRRIVSEVAGDGVVL
jgi:hypothetical protein